MHFLTKTIEALFVFFDCKQPRKQMLMIVVSYGSVELVFPLFRSILEAVDPVENQQKIYKTQMNIIIMMTSLPINTVTEKVLFMTTMIMEIWINESKIYAKMTPFLAGKEVEKVIQQHLFRFYNYYLCFHSSRLPRSLIFFPFEY